MSTEVGSLNASLTLDLGNFKAGMVEAASLAAELGAQLQSIFTGNAGFSRMSADVMELVAQLGLLKGSMEAFQASLQVTSGADLFAQMRTNTAALPTEIASISSALSGVMTNATQMNSTFQAAAISLSEAAAAATLLATSTSTGTSGLNFSAPLAQLTEMQAMLTQMLTTMQQVNTIDMSTGAISGEGDQLPIFYGLLTTIQEISAEFTRISGLIQQCTVDTGAWLAALGQVKASTETIQRQMRIASGVAGGTAKGTNSAAAGAKNLANQTGKASKNLQTTKGYAVSINGILGGIVIAQAFYSLLNVMEELVNGAVKFSETMQDAGVAFKYLMQDAGVSSGAFLNALKDIALQSPLDTTDLASASRKLMAMGFSAQATVPALQTLTDTAAVFSNGAGDMSDMIDHIALAFGQMMASGKVSAQELRQLYNAGLPIYQLLSDGLGISMEMAKNIGHYNVDSATAVYAVLDQLQKKYGGAAKEMTTTMTGAMEMIREGMQQLISYGWSDTFNALTTKVASFSQYIRALTKITQAYGVGGLFQAIFPPSTWSTLRSLIGGLQSVGLAIKQVFQIAAQVFGGGLQIIGMIASTVLPVIGGVANGLLMMARAALAASPALRIILSLIAALVIGGIVAKAVLFLAKAIWLLTGAKAAAKAIGSLVGSLIAFGAAHPIALTVLVAISAAFLAIVASSQRARAAIAAFFGGIGSKFNDFTQKLGLGFDPSKIAMPEFKAPDLSDFSSGIDDLTKGMDDLTKSTDKAGKSAKKNLQSFDEVFTIDNDASGSATDAMDSMADAINAIGGMDYNNLFDWTGDWAKDWGEISAGIGGVDDALGDIFGDMGDIASKFWTNIKDALMKNPEVTGALLGGAIGAVIGGLIGGKAGALIGAAIGALAGWIVGDFWKQLAEKWGLGPEAGTAATLATAIGGGIGALVGAAFGGKWGAILGGIIGGALGGFGELIWKKLKESFGISEEAGARNLGTAIFTGITSALKYVVTGIAQAATKANWSEFIGAVSKTLKTGLLKGISGALAGIGLSFLTDWLVGAVGKAVGKSEAEISTAEEWSSWGGTILGVIGAILGTFVFPAVGTLVLGLVGQLIGSIGGGALGLWKDEIGGFFKSIGKWIVQAIKDIGEWISTAASDVGSFFTTTLPNFFAGIGPAISGAISGAFEGIHTFFTETVPGWFSDFGESLGKFFTETIPAALKSAGYNIGFALGTAVRALITFFTETIPNMITSIKEAFVTFFTETIPNAFNTAVKAISTFFTVTIPDLWKSFLAALKTFFTETIPNTWDKFITSLKDFFKNLGDEISKFFTETIPDAFNKFITSLKTFFTETIPQAWNDFLKSLKDFFTNVITDISNFFTVTLPQKWKTFVEGVKQLAKDIINGIVDGLETAAKTVWDWIKSFFSGFTQGFKDAFGIASPAKNMMPIGKNILEGLLQGILGVASTIKTWLTTNVYNPIKSWFTTNLSTTNFVSYGKNIIQGVIDGISSLQNKLVKTTSDVFTAVKNKIKEVFHINSPSKDTTEMGEFIDQGLINGMANLMKATTTQAATLSKAVSDKLQIEDPTSPQISLSNASNTSLTSLTTWSNTFTSILATTFSTIASMFDGLSARLNAATASLATIPTNINASVGSLSAVDQLSSRTSDTTGTSTLTRVLADLSDATIGKFADSVSAKIYEYLAPIFANMGSGDQQRVLAYVGTLIGDERSLKELNKKLHIIQLEENERTGR